MSSYVFNDLDKQKFKRNHKLIRQVRYERACSNFLSSIDNLEEAYFERFIESSLVRSQFDLLRSMQQAFTKV